MAIVTLDQLEEGTKPELVIGLVAAVGAPLGVFTGALEDLLEARGYDVRLIHLSDFLMKAVNLPTPPPPVGANEYTRISALMNRGNELRESAGSGEALALWAAAHISGLRPEQAPRSLPGKAFILRQLKHPDEVEWLRRIYGHAFHLIGLYCPRAKREKHLRVVRRLAATEVEDLIKRDEEEPARWGQHLRDAFHLADVFVEQWDDSDIEKAEGELARFLKLLFGDEIISPTRDEYGMSLAHAAAHRSADLSRQVGAAILAPGAEVLSLGCNEVPQFGGGQYEHGKNDQRNHVLGYDSNDRVKRETLEEIVEHFDPHWKELEPNARRAKLEELTQTLSTTRLMNLTEFGRAVHAEMEAIIGAGRVGVSVRGATLYTTTFPCHNCAKHIVDSGVKRVVYVEPYPKSLARRLHEDSIALDDDSTGTEPPKVHFDHFVGIAPRRYGQLFSTLSDTGRRLRRKDACGDISQHSLGYRLPSSPLSYTERESVAALAAERIGKRPVKGGQA
ncbi:MAG TPA: anti-phage dCTP deaminase [Gemmatimonadales bacterium]|nr:anti-phage dCTP deaminase [Gemmatimonadales bacterium]